MNEWIPPSFFQYLLISSTMQQPTYLFRNMKISQISEWSGSIISVFTLYGRLFLIWAAFHYGVTFEWHGAGCHSHVLRFPLISSTSHNNDYFSPSVCVIVVGASHAGPDVCHVISGIVQIQTHLPELLTFISPLSWQPSPVIDNTNTLDEAQPFNTEHTLLLYAPSPTHPCLISVSPLCLQFV